MLDAPSAGHDSSGITGTDPRVRSEGASLIRPWWKEADNRHVGLQVFRCSTSLAANYRSACLARSRKEFSAKIGIVREEADESLFWLIFVQRAGMDSRDPSAVAALINEARQLARIFSAAYRTSKVGLGHRLPESRARGEQ
jgi:four helix bundle protein